MFNLDDFLEKLADDILDEFPDPNPLSSLFVTYIGYDIAEYVRNYNKKDC